MVARLGRVDPRSNERRVRPWRPVGRMDPYSQDRQLLRLDADSVSALCVDELYTGHTINSFFRYRRLRRLDLF